MAGKWLQNANERMEKKGTKGAFSGWADRKGMSTREAASKVMADKEDYSPERVKQANFARNAMRAGKS